MTLTQIAALRATRDNPRYSVMFMDDIGVDLAKKEDLIEHLPVDRIPNMGQVLKRFIFNDGYGAGFAMSSVGLVYNSAAGKPLASYGELWDERFRKRFLMTSPKSTQSTHLLIAAVAVQTCKPYAEAQYQIEDAWPKMAELKPNVLSIFRKRVNGDAGGAGSGRPRRALILEKRLPLHGKRGADRYVFPARGCVCRH